MIKLLALDLDGTLLDSGGKISPENKLAIRRAIEAGVFVTIATGRRFRDALPAAIELELKTPIVTHNGALIKFVDSLDVYSSETLTTQTAIETIDIAREFGAVPLVSIDPIGFGTMLHGEPSADDEPLKKYLAWAESLHGEIAEDSIVKTENISQRLETNSTIHISFSGNCAQMNDLQAMLKLSLEGAANIFATEYPKRNFTLLDVVSPCASKGKALELIAEKNNLCASEVMVVGDNFNDLEMLEYAGCPVVMGNADASLLERREFYTTLTNNENGVAAAIENFILGDLNG